MDNITLARLLDETAALLEIDGADPFRIRSYRRAAEAVEQQTTQLATLATPEADPKLLLAIPGIGKGMAANIRDLVATGSMPLRTELLQKYRPTMLELLRLPGMGPKSVALIWSALQVADIDALETAAKAGHLNKLPRMGEKFTAKLLKGIEDHRKNSSRFRIDHARDFAERIATLILAFPGIETVTPAGSLRRGRETVGDLDLLATGPACEPDVVAAAVEYVATLPLIDKLHARGQNKVTFTLRNNLQVDVRLLPRASYGAALQYFSGSKMHNVALRQRAIKRGLTLSEYALLRLEDNVIVAAASEADIYNALDLDYIAPELRENSGELEAAATHTLPNLITLADIRGDVHMHTTETDGTRTIREMAEAAIARGLRYIAITDHSKNLAMTNGMDDARALAHAKRVREVNDQLAEEFAAGKGPQWAAWESYEKSQGAPSSPTGSPSVRVGTYEADPGGPSPSNQTTHDPRIALPPHYSQLPYHRPMEPFRIFTGIEVDILAEGQLDLEDETLAQLDIVIASVHSRFDQPEAQITERILRAIENPWTRVLGHPTGRKVLKRDPYAVNVDTILRRAAELSVAVEHNAAPARADLMDTHLKLAKELGCKISVNTDAHAIEELDYMQYGITQLRRAWLTAGDILNTLATPDDFLAALRPKP
ncbi:PHP domain-containing protein [Granulicella sibirica]|nr:PHP domain-containing protein [Granulicella sibirica]